MTLLGKAEMLFFAKDTTDVLRSAGPVIAIIVGIGMVSVALFGGIGITPGLFLLGGVFLIPALIFYLLSRSIASRHPITVLLVWILCLYSLIVLLRGIPLAAEGVKPEQLFKPILYIFGALELAITIGLAWFVFHLYRHGKFTNIHGKPGNDP